MWTQCTSVTDGRTDGQTNRQTDRITITKTVQRIASHGKNAPKPLSTGVPSRPPRRPPLRRDTICIPPPPDAFDVSISTPRGASVLAHPIKKSFRRRWFLHCWYLTMLCKAAKTSAALLLESMVYVDSYYHTRALVLTFNDFPRRTQTRFT